MIIHIGPRRITKHSAPGWLYAAMIGDTVDAMVEGSGDDQEVDAHW